MRTWRELIGLGGARVSRVWFGRLAESNFCELTVKMRTPLKGKFAIARRNRQTRETPAHRRASSALPGISRWLTATTST